MTDGLAPTVAAKPVVNALGGAFMISAEAKAAGQDGGYHGWGLYFAGRGGVIGPAPVEVVESLFAFHAPELVRTGWSSGLSVRPIEETVTRYVDACHAWGRRHYTGFDGAERLTTLAARVVEAADPVGAPLYAGWLRLERPTDAPALVAHLLHLLREHRGGAHLAAIRVAGIAPLAAVIAGAGGARNAAFFGWPEPYPVVDADLQSRRARAEELTDELVAPAYAALSSTESTELVELLGLAAAQAAAHR
jgi:hypothetical protein